MTFTFPELSLPKNYKAMISLLQRSPPTTGDPQWAETPAQGPSAHPTPVLGVNMLLGNGFCPVSAHFNLCVDLIVVSNMIQL